MPVQAALCAIVGFYDGFFGPGAGSFYTVILVALGGLGIVRATGHTKALNFASNAAGLITMIIGGHVLWTVGLPMVAGNIVGNNLGARTAMRFGRNIIKPLLVVISLALTIKMLADPANPVRGWIDAGLSRPVTKN